MRSHVFDMDNVRNPKCARQSPCFGTYDTNFPYAFHIFFHWMMLENVRKPTWCSLHISKLLDLSHVPGILACGMTWGSFLAVWHYGITSYFPKDDPINFPFFSPLDNVENPKFPKCVHKISGWLWIKTLLKKLVNVGQCGAANGHVILLACPSLQGVAKTSYDKGPMAPGRERWGGIRHISKNCGFGKQVSD